MKSLSKAALLLTVLAIVSCAPAAEEAVVEETPTTEADVAAVLRVREQAVAAINAGDMGALMALWSDDIVWMWPNEPPVVGKEALRSWWEAHRSPWTAEMTVVHEEIVVAGDWAFQRGTHTGRRIPKAGGEPREIDQKCIDILRRQPDGSWKTTHVICNPNKPGTLFE